ncbi:hypothetical protein CE91St36_06540 [Christensenellaceae bacterium]|nr:hypothetical protein CE91St36_06540 [Christensenellaceae bacterium]BDF60505.1 hypothetical protein CE91St37_06550 [Christensenellaceae bacterium]
MKGHRFVVSGDPAMARNTVYTTLENQGFTLTHVDDWSADAQRGSSGASVLLGAFAGKKGRHVKLRVSCQSSPEGTVITLIQGTSGASGGLIGVSQASGLYSDIYDAVGLTFQNAGVLVSNGNL